MWLDFEKQGKTSFHSAHRGFIYLLRIMPIIRRRVSNSVSVSEIVAALGECFVEFRNGTARLQKWAKQVSFRGVWIYLFRIVRVIRLRIPNSGSILGLIFAAVRKYFVKLGKNRRQQNFNENLAKAPLPQFSPSVNQVIYDRFSVNVTTQYAIKNYQVFFKKPCILNFLKIFDVQKIVFWK